MRRFVVFVLTVAAIPSAVGLLTGISEGRSGGNALILAFAGFCAFYVGCAAGVLAIWAVVAVGALPVLITLPLWWRHRDDPVPEYILVPVAFIFLVAMLGALGVGTYESTGPIYDLVRDGPSWAQIAVRAIMLMLALLLAWGIVRALDRPRGQA
jgi:MFS superfamily sulfate permease-like transporter